MTEGPGDTVVFDDAGGNHVRPNERRLVAGEVDGEVLVVEQMIRDGQWVDLGVAFSVSEDLDVEVGERAIARGDR
jgi:hypothetical protein